MLSNSETIYILELLRVDIRIKLKLQLDHDFLERKILNWYIAALLQDASTGIFRKRKQ